MHATYDTGADIHVTNRRELFTSSEPPEYTHVIGIDGKEKQAEYGKLLNLGKCLYMPECSVTMVPQHVLEEFFMIDYTPTIGYMYTYPMIVSYQYVCVRSVQFCQVVEGSDKAHYKKVVLLIYHFFIYTYK